jgi:hypothetical protein
MQQWEYLELLVEGMAWLDSLGRSGQLPLVGGAAPAPAPAPEARQSRWGRPEPSVLGSATAASIGVGAGRRWESLGPLLNDLGEDGWELSGVVTTTVEHRLSSAEFRLLFKRPKR